MQIEPQEMASRMMDALPKGARDSASVSIHHLCGGGMRSWVVHFREYWPLDGPTLDALWASHPDEFDTMRIMGREVAIPRWQKMFGSVHYKFSGYASLPEPMESQEQCLEFQSRVSEALGLRDETYNGCLVNWYDGSRDHYIGPHKDDEKSMVRGMPIFSMSWGETRRFRLKLDAKRARPPGGDLADAVESLVLELAHGDLVVMGGDCQTTHKHEIMKLRKDDPRGRRVNLTLRAFHQ